MARYASATTVPAERSRMEIERLLAKYGADQFAAGWDLENATLAFRARGRMVKFVLALPKKDDRQFTVTGARGLLRSSDTAFHAWDQEVRRRWRALLLVIKAKLEAVDSGISDFESEFLANIQLQDGSLFGGWAKIALAAVYDTGRSLPAYDPKKGTAP